MNIDWSKAPEDATHAGTTTGLKIPVFYKDIREDKYSYWYDDGDGWREDATGNPSCTPLIERTKKQEAWDGAGLPTAGTECEWKEKSGFQWVAATILFITDSSVVCKRSDGFEWQMPTKRTVFRPIKTAEQLAEEERKSQLEVMHKIYMEGASEHKGGLAALYDAGYKLAK